MSSTIANEVSNWVSGVIRPVSHSSEVKRSRKADKNRKARQRKQARQRDCTPHVTHATGVLVAASHDGDTAPAVDELRLLHRHEHKGAALSAGSSILPNRSEKADKLMISAADLIDTGAAARSESGVIKQRPSAPTEDMVAMGIDHDAAAEEKVDLHPSQPPPEPPLQEPSRLQPETSPTEPQPSLPSPPQPPQSRHSYFMEEGTEEFEEWTRNRDRLTAWAREADAEMKRARGEEPDPCHRRYAPAAGQFTLPILSRTAAFAVQCGFGPGVAPQLLNHVVRTVFGEVFASSVVALSIEEVDFMFGVFWEQQVVPFTESERLFRLAADFRSDNGLTGDNLRPLITGAVQNHPEFLELTLDNQIRYLENVVSTTLCRLGRCGVISLPDLRRSDFAASLNAVGRHEIGLEESIYFSRFTSLSVAPSPGYQQPSGFPYGRSGVSWSTGLCGGLSSYGNGNPNACWATSPSTVAVGSWR